MRSIKTHFFNDYLHDRLFETDEDNKQGRSTNWNGEKWESNYSYNKEKKEISQDLFSLFHNKGLEYTDSPNEILKQFLDETKESNDFKSAKDNTVGNDFLSYFAGKDLKEKFDESLPELSKKMEDIQKNPNNQQAKDEASEYISKNRKRIQSKIRQIVRKVEGDVEDVKEVFQVAGYDLSNPNNEKVDMKGKLELAKKLTSNDNFKKIIDMIGRRVNLANHHIKTSTTRGSNEVIGVEQGNDLENVVPSDLAMLQDEDLSIEFIRQHSNASLSQWKMKGKGEESDGDIIVVLDQSGSMYGDLDMYAKSFAFGMWCMAKNANKKLHLIPFSNRAKLVEIQLESECLAFLNEFMGGGTDYDKPLKLANEVIESVSKKADVFFLTDGEGNLSEAILNTFIANKEKNGFKVLSVNLAEGNNEVLKKFSDKVWNFTLTDGKVSNDFLNEAFASVI